MPEPDVGLYRAYILVLLHEGLRDIFLKFWPGIKSHGLYNCIYTLGVIDYMRHIYEYINLGRFIIDPWNEKQDLPHTNPFKVEGDRVVGIMIQNIVKNFEVDMVKGVFFLSI